MPSVDVHLEQIIHNESVAEAMVVAGFYDWAVIALFYSSLNLMQAYLLDIGILAETHGKRQRAILSRPELAEVVQAYDLLKIQSENARYNCDRFDHDRFERIRSGPYSRVMAHLRELRGST